MRTHIALDSFHYLTISNDTGNTQEQWQVQTHFPFSQVDVYAYRYQAEAWVIIFLHLKIYKNLEHGWRHSLKEILKNSIIVLYSGFIFTWLNYIRILWHPFWPENIYKVHSSSILQVPQSLFLMPINLIWFNSVFVWDVVYLIQDFLISCSLSNIWHSR